MLIKFQVLQNSFELAKPETNIYLLIMSVRLQRPNLPNRCLSLSGIYVLPTFPSRKLWLLEGQPEESQDGNSSAICSATRNRRS